MATDQGYVFISYKSEEINKAKELRQFLEQEGYKCWMAPDSLHKRGTQDYGNDIFEAIRNSNCVLFAVSNLALCSDWVRKEVKYALEKCHKPIVPFVVDTIPSVKYDSDELMISLSLQKQILNEDLSNNFTTILPYVEHCIQPEVKNEQQSVQAVPVFKHKMTNDEYKLIEKEVKYSEKRIEKFSKIDYLDKEGEYRPFAVYQQELASAVRIAACGLIREFRAISEGVIEKSEKEIDSILERLYKLTYEFGKYYNQDVFSLVEPMAKNGDPWACFVMHVKYYNPDAGVSENVHPVAYQFLMNAVKDSANSYAAILFGTCYQWGIGCDVSGAKAQFWYECALGEDSKGKKAKCPAAYSYLGRLYEHAPFGIEPSDKKAEEYYKKGVAAKDACASWRYGLFLLKKHKNKGEEKALDQFILAYERGEIRALADIVYLIKKNTKSNLLKKQEYKEKYKLNRLERLAEKADLSRLKYFECYKDIFERKDEDVIIGYATDGVIKKDCDCAEVLADALVKIAQQDILAILEGEKESEAQTKKGKNNKELDEFLQAQLSCDQDKSFYYIKASLEDKNAEFFKNENNDITLDGYQEQKPPKSYFWKKLILTDKVPSALEDYVLFSPYKLLEAIKKCPKRDHSSLSKVIDVWNLSRDLDFEKYDCEQMGKGHFSFLSRSNCVQGSERYAFLIEKIEKLIELIPEFEKDWLAQIGDMKEILKSQLKTMSISDVENKLKKIYKSIFEIAERNKELRLAKHLFDIEHKISHPALSVAMNYYRLAYLWGREPRFTNKMASLFLVNNARLKDVNQNEGLIYFISSEIEKCVYQMDPNAVPFFLEISLFGVSVGQSRVEPNFEAIAKADPAIFAMVQRKGENTIYDRILKLEISLAMSKIYNDKHLCNSSRCEQQWGVSSLYNPAKTLQWIKQSIYLLNGLKGDQIKKTENLSDFEKKVFYMQEEINEYLSRKLIELSKKGFKPIHNYLKGAEKRCSFASAEKESLSKFLEMNKELFYKWGTLLSRMKLNFYQNVSVCDGDIIDGAIADDSKILLIHMLPGDKDFRIESKFESNKGKAKIDNGVATLGFMSMLVKGKQKIEEDLKAKVLLGVFASKKTIKNIKTKNLDASLQYLEYENIEEDLKRIFPE